MNNPDDPVATELNDSVIVGSGRRFFPDNGAPAGLRLLSYETTPSGVAAQVYETTGLARYGTYEADAHS
jgi:hypothetical protein